MKRVVLVGFDGAEGLDLFGPAEVFTGAGRRLGVAAYEMVLASERGGPIVLTSGASVATRGLTSIRPRPGDTVLVAGGADRALDEAASNRFLIEWLVRRAAAGCEADPDSTRGAQRKQPTAGFGSGT